MYRILLTSLDSEVEGVLMMLIVMESLVERGQIVVSGKRDDRGI